MITTYTKQPTDCSRHSRNLQHVYNSFSILYFNARSVLPKLSELASVAAQSSPDVIAVTETWLNPSVPDGALLLPNYSTIVRDDRTERRGGGVMLFIRDDLQFSVRPDLTVWHESVWIEIRLRQR